MSALSRARRLFWWEIAALVCSWVTAVVLLVSGRFVPASIFLVTGAFWLLAARLQDNTIYRLKTEEAMERYFPEGIKLLDHDAWEEGHAQQAIRVCDCGHPTLGTVDRGWRWFRIAFRCQACGRLFVSERETGR